MVDRINGKDGMKELIALSMPIGAELSAYQVEKTEEVVSDLLQTDERITLDSIRSKLECFTDESSSKVDVYNLSSIQTEIEEAKIRGIDVSEFDAVDWAELDRRKSMYSIRSKLECFADESSSRVDVYNLSNIQTEIEEAMIRGIDVSEFDEVDWAELDTKQTTYRERTT